MTDHSPLFAGGALGVHDTAVADLGLRFVKASLGAGKGMRILQGLTGGTQVVVRLRVVMKPRQEKLVVCPSDLGSGCQQGDIRPNSVIIARDPVGTGALAGIRNGSLKGDPPTKTHPPGQIQQRRVVRSGMGCHQTAHNDPCSPPVHHGMQAVAHLAVIGRGCIRINRVPPIIPFASVAAVGVWRLLGMLFRNQAGRDAVRWLNQRLNLSANCFPIEARHLLIVTGLGGDQAGVEVLFCTPDQTRLDA